MLIFFYHEPVHIVIVMSLSKISVCILSKNSSQTISETLASVKDFSEILVLDNGSTDNTIEIVKKHANAKVIEHAFIGFGFLRNKAAEHAASDWILALDTDEILSDALLEELKTLELSNEQAVYSTPRKNFYNGKWIRGCGWHPDRVTRLYNRKATKFRDVQVHESLITDESQIISLKSPLLHTPFRSTAEFLSKMQHYSSLFANQNAPFRKSSLPKAFFHSLFAFFRSYFFQKGFLLGAEGFIVSLYNSNTTFYKYLKLWEKK